jgi:hypothetical protein
LDCGGPPPLFPGTIAQSVFIRVHPWLKIQTPVAPVAHPKMNSGNEFPSAFIRFRRDKSAHFPCGIRIEDLQPIGFCEWRSVPNQL